MKTTLSMLLAFMAASSHAQITQNWESGSISAEQAKGWAFGAQGLKCPTCTPSVPFASGGGSAIQGSYSSETNALSNPANVFASWVKTPWAIWDTGTISLDARLGATHSSTYKIVFLFIPWDKCAANEEGTATALQYEYTMSNNLNDQTVSFSVPSVVLDGKPWKMRVGFSGTGGSTRIRHDNWSLPAKAAFYDTDSDNIPDAMDKYPGDNTNNGKAAILSRVWNDQDADGIQDNCEPGIMGITVKRGSASETSKYNGYVAFFDVASGSQTLVFGKPANTFTYYTLQDEGSDDNVDSDVCGSGRTSVSTGTSVVSNIAVGYSTPRVTQNWESGDRPAEQAKGWEFGANTINNSFTGGGSAVQGTWSAQTNGLSSSNLSSSWVKTPWIIWSAGNFSMDARLNATGANTYKVIFRFIPWNSCNNFQQGTITSAVHEFTMANTLDVQNISFPVPSTVLDGKPWKIQVSFIGTGGSSRIVHDNWSAPGAAAFYDTDSDNIPDAMDEYPADNTNDGKAAIFARAWNDKNADGIQNDCGAGIEGAIAVERSSGGSQISQAVTGYNGYVAFFCIPSGSSRILSFNGIAGHTYAQQDQGTDDAIDSDISSSTGRTASFTATGVVSNLAAGYLVPGSVTTFVWDDQDADGIQDAGEPGLSNVTVTLRNSSGTVLQTTATDANGIATFEDVPTGTLLRLGFLRPTGHTFTTADQGSDDAIDADVDPATSRTGTFSLTQGSQNYTLMDCGMWAPGTVNSFVWDDQDADGIQDAGEPGLSNVTVTLRNSAGSVLQTTATDANGIATFNDVPTGTLLRLGFGRPTGHTFTTADQGSDDAIDADVDPATSRTGTFSLTQGSQNYTLMDCGMWAPGTITTFVWGDVDNDGIQDAGELGLSNVTVTLRNSAGTLLQTTTTNASGIATFSNVPTATNIHLRYVRPSTAWTISPKDQGSDDAIDSDAGTASPFRTDDFSLTQGSQNYTLMDCGMYNATLYSNNRIALKEEKQILRENGNSLQPGANGGIATGNIQQVQKPAAASNNGASNILAGVQVYPNPATTAFHVAIMAPEAAAVSYVLTDASGKTVRNGNWKLNAGANTFSLDVNNLPAGVYQLRAEGGDIAHSARVVVIK
jgi:hypothetical protein